MKELLSNEEIDSLLALFRAESGEVTPLAPMGEVASPFQAHDPVSALDLLKPNRFGRERLQLLERLFASAARAVGALLTERLRVEALCDCVAVEQVRFASWRRQLEGPVGVWSVAAEPFASPVLFTITSGLLRGAVDRLLGGSGRVAAANDVFTAAELAVAEALVEPLVDRIAGSLSDVVALSPKIDGRTGNPATVQAMAPNDVALAVYLQVGGEVLHGDIRLVFAYQDLEPFLDRIAEGRGPSSSGSPDEHRGAVARSLQRVPLDLSVVLGRTRISVRSLLGLRVGDVVRLDRLVAEPLTAEIAGETKMRGFVQRAGSARTFRVTEVAKEDHHEQT